MTVAEQHGRLTIDAAGHEIYYRLFGSGPESLLCLHGGPGGDHRGLERLRELAGDGLQVLLYDQLGSGKSDRPDDASLWTVERFVDEVETVRSALGLGRVHLLGQSWGGMLGLQYAVDHPEGLRSLILSNTGSSANVMFQGMTRLRLEMGADFFTRMALLESTGRSGGAEYAGMLNEVLARHLRRPTPFDAERAVPEFVSIMGPLMDGTGPAFTEMWGADEFRLSGNLVGWDVTDRLAEIRVPTLILTGSYDEVDMTCHRILADGIADNEFVIFGNSSHHILAEKEADVYLSVVRDFVRRRSA
jgi:proline-specific peptidase